jgi:hypothetical protein
MIEQQNTAEIVIEIILIQKSFNQEDKIVTGFNGSQRKKWNQNAYKMKKR